MLLSLFPKFRFFQSGERRLVFNDAPPAGVNFVDTTPLVEEMAFNRISESVLEEALAGHGPEVGALFAKSEEPPAMSSGNISFRHLALERIQEDVRTFVADNRRLIGDVLSLPQAIEISDSAGERQDRLNAIRSVALISARRVIAEILAEQKSEIDEMTGLLRKDAFDQRLGTEIKRASRSKQSMVLIGFDVDHFKDINDTYGHPVGDKVLKAIAQVMNQILRASDVKSRHGGEEFCALLLDTSLVSTQDVAFRLNREIRKAVARIAELQSETITVSMGVVEATVVGTAEIILQEVDDLIYMVKDNGRNGIAAKGEIQYQPGKSIARWGALSLAAPPADPDGLDVGADTIDLPIVKRL